MHARFALVAGSALALVFAVRCTGGGTKPAVVAPASPPPPDAAPDAGEGGAGGAEALPERPRPDPALVQKALDRTGTPTANDEASHGLRFEVVEIGPSKSWALAVINRGSEPMAVAFDPRLLTLEVAPPPDPKAKKPAKPRVCRLPDELRPTRADAAYTISLAPGHGLVEAFDPRLYCLPQGGVSPLVAGSQVSATLGWPVKTKTVWQRGKRVEEVLPQTPPFVARVEPPAKATDAGADAGEDAAADAAAGDAGGEIVMTDSADQQHGGPRDEGIKELHSTPFELGNDYAQPSKPALPGLALEVTQGSDAHSEAQATVTVRLSNHGSTQADVYFRRELLTFAVSSVDGTELCEPGPDDRAPDRQAFTHLAPGGAISVTSRLAEMCPKDVFARPGLYLVQSAFDGEVTGAEFGFDAFVGHVASERAATVRVRTGTLPFPGERTLEEVQVGVAPTK